MSQIGRFFSGAARTIGRFAGGAIKKIGQVASKVSGVASQVLNNPVVQAGAALSGFGPEAMIAGTAANAVHQATTNPTAGNLTAAGAGLAGLYKAATG